MRLGKVIANFTTGFFGSILGGMFLAVYLGQANSIKWTLNAKDLIFLSLLVVFLCIFGVAILWFALRRIDD